MGREFSDNAIPVLAERAQVRLSGYIGLPTSTARTPATSTCSSTAVRCATGCWWAPCAEPTPTSWPATATRWRRSSWKSIRRKWTSTSIRPRRRCASAISALVRGLIVGALRHALAASGPPGLQHGRDGDARRLLRRHTRRRPATAAGFPLRFQRRAILHVPRDLADAVAAYQAPLAGFAATPSASPAAPVTPAADRTRPNIRWARPGRRSTTPTSSPRPATASSSSISTPPTNGWSTSG